LHIAPEPDSRLTQVLVSGCQPLGNWPVALDAELAGGGHAGLDLADVLGQLIRAGQTGTVRLILEADEDEFGHGIPQILDGSMELCRGILQGHDAHRRDSST
jgi:hypothetical protein